jgi:hypothetical protein
MPEGPARRPGRSEAKSIDDAEHGASVKRAMVRCRNLDLQTRRHAGNTCDAHELISVLFASGIVAANLDTNACGTGGAFVLLDMSGRR